MIPKFIAGIIVIVRWTFWILPRGVVARYLGLGLDFIDTDATPAPKAVYAEAISLFSLAATNGFVLAVALQKTDEPPDWKLLALYSAVAASITLGMVIILNAEATEPSLDKPGEKRKHAYEKGSIMFNRLFVCVVPLMAASIAWMGYCGEIPGQTFSTRTDIKIEKAEIYHFKDTNQDGVVAYALFGPGNFKSERVPTRIDAEITLAKSLGVDWIVEDAVCVFSAPDEKEKPKYQPFIREPKKESPYTWAVLFEALKPERKYEFKVFVHPREDRAPSAQAAKDMIQSKGVMTIVFKSAAK